MTAMKTNQGRLDLYRNVHKGIRVLLFDLVQKAGRLDFGDEAALARYKAEVRDAFELLTGHAHNEDEYLMPLVAKHAPKLFAEFEEAHEDQEMRLPYLLVTLDHIQSADEGHRWTVQLSRIAGELLVHMADEEDRLNDVLWSAMSDAELHEVEQSLVGSIPPEKMARYLTWMLPAMNTEERATFLGSLQAGAPEPVFLFVRGLASQVLSPADDAKLEKALTAELVAVY